RAASRFSGDHGRRAILLHVDTGRRRMRESRPRPGRAAEPTPNASKVIRRPQAGKGKRSKRSSPRGGASPQAPRRAATTNDAQVQPLAAWTKDPDILAAHGHGPAVQARKG